MIRLAEKIAKQSRCGNQHGAVISKGRRVLGMGCNLLKTHPVLGGGPVRAVHAEAAAIRDAVRKGVNLNGKDIYVTRINCENRLSRPCPDCERLLRKYGIRRVFYTNEKGTIVVEVYRAKN